MSGSHFCSIPTPDTRSAAAASSARNDHAAALDEVEHTGRMSTRQSPAWLIRGREVAELSELRCHMSSPRAGRGRSSERPREVQHGTTRRSPSWVDPTRQSCMSATPRLMRSPGALESGAEPERRVPTKAVV